MPSEDEKRGRDPHVGLTFWVQVDGIEVAGFSECSGLTLETEVTEYAEGGLNTHTHKLPVRTKYGNVTLKRGIDPGEDLHKWFIESIDGVPNKRKNVSIQVYGPDGKGPLKKWDLMGAFPVKWSGPDLKTEAGAVTVETFEFAHNGLVPGG